MKEFLEKTNSEVKAVLCSDSFEEKREENARRQATPEGRPCMAFEIVLYMETFFQIVLDWGFLYTKELAIIFV